MLKQTFNKGISTPIAVGIILILVILVGGFTWWQYGEMWKESTELPEIEIPEKKDETADWQSYTNEKYGYSLKYPENCLLGTLPGYCRTGPSDRLKPPEERPQECLCYFNAENPDRVFLEIYIGAKVSLTGGSGFVVSHYSTGPYNPPVGTDLVGWVKENFSHYDDIPDEINMEIDGIPALRVYTPFSATAWGQENIYFIKNDKLLEVSMLDIDDEDNRALYDQILSTFKVSE